MNEFLDEPIYILVMRNGLKKDIDDESLNRIIMSIYSTKEDAIKAKENAERRAEEAGFGDYDKYYIEPWRVHAPFKDVN